MWNVLGVDSVEVRLFAISFFVSAFESHRTGGAFRCTVSVHSPCGRNRCAASFSTAGRHLRALLLQNRLARETDAIAFHCQDFHQNLIAFAKLVLDVLHAMLGNFRDMQQTVGSGNDLDERAKLSESRDLSQVRLADFSRRRDLLDHLDRLISRRRI